MSCLQLCVLFNFEICDTFPPVFMNIFSGRGYPCTNALSVLVFSGHGEFETGLFIHVWHSHSREFRHLASGNFDPLSRFAIHGIHADVKDWHGLSFCSIQCDHLTGFMMGGG